MCIYEYTRARTYTHARTRTHTCTHTRTCAYRDAPKNVILAWRVNLQSVRMCRWFRTQLIVKHCVHIPACAFVTHDDTRLLKFEDFTAVTLRHPRVVLKGQARYSLSLPSAAWLLFYSFKKWLLSTSRTRFTNGVKSPKD